MNAKIIYRVLELSLKIWRKDAAPGEMGMFLCRCIESDDVFVDVEPEPVALFNLDREARNFIGHCYDANLKVRPIIKIEREMMDYFDTMNRKET